MIRFIVSVLLMIMLICGILIIEGFHPGSFAAFTPFAAAIGIPFVASLGIWGFGDLAGVFRDAFSVRKSGDREKSLRICVFYERLLYLAGITGTILGSIAVLLKIVELGSMNAVCRGFAVSLLSSVYAAVFAAIVRIIAARIENTRGKA